ncbi:MAG: cysteine peptidase family C39 domain-containing protein [Candidatus Uhrbacteria bacterium]
MKTLKFSELRQTYNWDCGANAIQSVLAYYGIDVRESIVMKIAGTTRGGTPISGIKKVVKKYGLKQKSGKMEIDDIKQYLDNEIPVILLVQAWTEKNNVDWEKDWVDGHYVVAIGYDKTKLYFEDPSSVLRTYLTYNEFMKRWHDVDKNGKKYINWGMAVFGKKAEYDLSKPIHMD